MTSETPAVACADCGNRFDPSPNTPHRCDCGGPLELSTRPSSIPDLSDPVTSLASVSAHVAGDVVDLGVGGTPLVHAADFDATFKLETCNPTGSFKDRGAATTIARARAVGASLVREDSSGNAGRAIAAHAARGGLSARIYVPAEIDAATRKAIASTGAEVVAIDGNRAAVASACEADDTGWYASHAWRPSFYAGTATLAWEVVADRNGSAPEAMVIPVGHGTLLLGVFRGFRRLHQAGAIQTIPRLHAAQLAGAGSLLPEADDDVPSSVAPGVRVPRPARAKQVRAAIATTGGEVVGVSPASVSQTHDDLRRAGFACGSTAALGVAGRRHLLERGQEPAESDVTVPLTGHEHDR